MLFVSPESVIPAGPNRKGCRVSPFCPCSKEPKLIAFGLKGSLVSIWSLPTQSSIKEGPFCHMLPKGRFRQIVDWSLVCFHISGVSPVGDGTITSKLTLVGPVGCRPIMM